jgi:hypothetical protein
VNIWQGFRRADRRTNASSIAGIIYFDAGTMRVEPVV